MFNQYDVLETIEMIEKEHLDIRTITMRSEERRVGKECP